MTPDKDQAPALMHQAADEAAHGDLYDAWMLERGISTERSEMKATIATLTVQLAAAEREAEYWKRLDHIHLVQVNRLQEKLAAAEERADQHKPSPAEGNKANNNSNAVALEGTKSTEGADQRS